MKRSPLALKEILCWLVLAGWVACCDADTASTAQEPIHYLVSKVYNEHGELVADYTYDAKNRLIRCAYKDPSNEYDVDITLDYVDGLVSRIDYIDHIFPWLSHEKRYFYDTSGAVSKLERWVEGALWTSWSVSCDLPSNRCSLSLNGQEPRTYFEIKDNNVVFTINHLIDSFNDEAYQQVRSFQYDTGKKPNFGLDYLIGTRFLPYADSMSLWETSLSDNNLIGMDNGKYTYIITYNNAGFPETITEKIEGIDWVDPRVLRIEYR